MRVEQLLLIILLTTLLFGCEPKEDYTSTQKSINNDLVQQTMIRQYVDWYIQKQVSQSQHIRMIDSIKTVNEGRDKILSTYMDKKREYMVDSIKNLPPDTIHQSTITKLYYQYLIEKEKNK